MTNLTCKQSIGCTLQLRYKTRRLRKLKDRLLVPQQTYLISPAMVKWDWTIFSNQLKRTRALTTPTVAMIKAYLWCKCRHHSTSMTWKHLRRITLPSSQFWKNLRQTRPTTLGTSTFQASQPDLNQTSRELTTWKMARICRQLVMLAKKKCSRSTLCKWMIKMIAIS